MADKTDVKNAQAEEATKMQEEATKLKELAHESCEDAVKEEVAHTKEKDPESVVHHPEKCPYLDPDERDQFVRSYWDVQEKHFNEKVISQLLHLDAD